MRVDRLNALLTRLIISLLAMVASFVLVRTFGQPVQCAIPLIFLYVVLYSIRIRREGRIAMSDFLDSMTSGVMLGYLLAHIAAH